MMNRNQVGASIGCLLFLGLAFTAVDGASDTETTVSGAGAAVPIMIEEGVEFESFDVVHSELHDLIQTLTKTLLSEQNTEEVSYRIGRWGKKKGLFPSFVHLNANGGVAQKAFRDMFQIPDNNMFVTQFVVNALLESVRLEGLAEDFEGLEESINIAVKAFEDYRDKNRDDGVALYGFWEQKEVNGTWVSQPDNLVGLMNTGSKYRTEMINYCWKHGLTKIGILLTIMDVYSQVFKIPADSDDTGVNLALGGLLSRAPKTMEGLSKQWRETNSDMAGTVNFYKRYAYRPFGNKYSPDDNLVDPRTYFWIREYLVEKRDEAHGHGKEPNIALISTWMSNVEETKECYEKSHGNVIPANVNNFDASVGANAIFGMSNMLLTSDASETTWFDDEAQQLYRDTAELIAWVINKRILQWRQDLVLLYYPPVYDFYWFVARHVQLLRSSGELPYPVMEEVRDMLDEAMTLAGTEQILSLLDNEYVSDSKTGKKVRKCHWEEFLGDGDKNVFGVPKPSHDDRIFSTAVAINALVDTWATVTPDGDLARLVWRENVPYGLRTTIACASSYVTEAINEGKLKLENAFFSGSLKGSDSDTWSFPMNRIQLFNGTSYECDGHFQVYSEDVNRLFEVVVGVEGMMDPMEYESKFSYSCVGRPVPLKFRGFNLDEETFNALPGWPYWSSPALTRAMVVLAQSKVLNVFRKEEE